MKVMFMGTPDFAVESLKSIHNYGHEICCVVTTPDKPRGRGHNITQTPVGRAADEFGFSLIKPQNLKKENFESILFDYNPDVIVVVAYGKILPEYVLEYPAYGCINVHASLLPEYRGAAPIQRAIIDGKKITGVTTMLMNKGLDTGDMLLKGETEITESDNFETLHDKLAAIGSDLIIRTLSGLENGTLTPEKQDDSKSTYAHMITKETALIDWTKSALDIYNLVRGLYPVPKAYTIYSGRRLKICACEMTALRCDKEPGTVINADKQSFFVCCGESSVIKITEIQAEGKRQMSVEDYFKGNSIENNSKVGV